MQSAFVSVLSLEAALIAAGLVAMFGTMAVLRVVTRAPEARTQGQIVDLVPAQDDDSPFDEAFPVVEFIDADGDVVRVTVRERLSRALHAVGETIALAYDPRDPKRVELSF